MKNNKYINIRAQINYEPKSPKLLWTWDPKKRIKHKTQTKKKRTSLRPQNFVEFKAPKNLRPQKRYEPKGPKPSWTQDTKKYESKGTRCLPANRQKIWIQGPKILRAEGESRSMFCECIWGGRRCALPPNPPPAVFFFKAYLLCRDSPPPPEASPPPIETIEKK